MSLFAPQHTFSGVSVSRYPLQRDIGCLPYHKTATPFLSCLGILAMTVCLMSHLRDRSRSLISATLLRWTIWIALCLPATHFRQRRWLPSMIPIVLYPWATHTYKRGVRILICSSIQGHHLLACIKSFADKGARGCQNGLGRRVARQIWSYNTLVLCSAARDPYDWQGPNP
ncbi:hypothetical protein GGR57DRAFT_463665 [Xylariaceae sp. FL1272]|nr:hypothetical protein GGR57DRAFT_463665 [Xylariaceae sp. FL1272]